MRWNRWLIFVPALILGAGLDRSAAAQNSQGTARRTAPPPVDQRNLDPILALWAQKSGQLTTLSVKIDRVDDQAKWGAQSYEGKALFKSPNLAVLDFSKIENGNPNKPAQKVFAERILCTGQEVWQYKGAEKKIYIYELGRQEQKRALQEGPLPFLFHFDAAKAKKRYDMRIQNITETNVVLSVIPKLPIDRDAFSAVGIVLDRGTFLPTRIYLVEPNGKDTRDYRLSNIVRNENFNDKVFQGIPLAGWKILREDARGQNAGQVPPDNVRGARLNAQPVR